MTRNEILDALKFNITETLDNVDTCNLDTSRTLMDIGANSLDIVEIVSRTMRQLKVKIPRSELDELGNMDALIDFIDKAANSNG